MGDAVFVMYLRRLTECKAPLLEQSEGVIRITEAGREVLAGKHDFVRLNGIDRWLGGVHLRGAEAQWRWANQRLASQ